MLHCNLTYVLYITLNHIASWREEENNKTKVIPYITIKRPDPFIQPGPTIDWHIPREREVHQTKRSAANKKGGGIHHRLVNLAKKEPSRLGEKKKQIERQMVDERKYA